MKKTIIYLALILLSGTLLLTSCSSNKSSNNATNPTSPTGNTPVMAASVTIENFTYSPITIHVLPGGTVTWTNKDATAHTVTDNGGAFDSGNIAVDATYKKTFPTAGTYTYHCTIHSMMPSATVVVGN